MQNEKIITEKLIFSQPREKHENGFNLNNIRHGDCGSNCVDSLALRLLCAVILI